jgi:hypothetical protein
MMSATNPTTGSTTTRWYRNRYVRTRTLTAGAILFDRARQRVGTWLCDILPAGIFAAP